MKKVIFIFLCFFFLFITGKSYCPNGFRAYKSGNLYYIEDCACITHHAKDVRDICPPQPE